MTADPRPIDASVALRLCADLLAGQALRLRARGDLRASPNPAKQQVRNESARKMEVAAQRLLGLSGDREFCAGRTVDASVLGYLVASLLGDAEARKELALELEAVHGREVLSRDMHPGTLGHDGFVRLVLTGESC